MQTRLDTLRAYLDDHFLIRWIIASVVGWSIGLYAASICLSILGGILGLIISGGVAGAIVGATQWWALRYDADWADQAWIWWSAAGGAVGAFPAFLLSFTLLIGWGIGFCMIGGLFAGIFSAIQAIFLARYTSNAGIWVVANILGGGLCGMLTLAANPFYLPICCTFGPIAFGVVTGYVLLRYLPALDS